MRCACCPSWLVRFACCWILAVCIAGCSGGKTCPSNCSGHGTCEWVEGNPLCKCDDGYDVSAGGKECLPGTACSGKDCSGQGVCVVGLDKNPACVCNPGYTPSADKLSCLKAGSCSKDGDCLKPPATSCNGAKLVTYQVPGTCSSGTCLFTAVEKQCSDKGCCQDHCCGLVPSNNLDLGELEPTGLNLTLASATFDTGSQCGNGSSLGNCRLVQLAQSPHVCVCRADSLQVSGELRVTGINALALFVWGDVQITGSINLAARADTAGPGASASGRAEAGGMFGGSGGSNGTKGGNLGDAPSANVRLAPLVGGQAGQMGCSARIAGAGGGAMQISAGGKIEINGSIHAGGGGGSGGAGGSGDITSRCLGGAGGGSGGSVLLEAPQVAVAGMIVANGGGGGGGGNTENNSGGNGSDAQASLTPASGGEGREGNGCALYNNTAGGDGGAGAVTNQDGGNGQSYVELQCKDPYQRLGGGGGGGGAGRIRINTKDTCNCTGTLSPTPSFGLAGGL